MTYNHLMIDIETLGTKSNSVILSIAAVNFDIDTGKTGAFFYQKIDMQSCLDYELNIDANTLNWWINQAPKVFKESFDNAKPLALVLSNLCAFCKNLKQDNIQVWGNSARFDLGLLENAHNKVAMLLPWSYYNERDVRTLVSFAPEIKTAIPFMGNKHDPLHDCMHQIKYCSRIWNLIKPK